MKIYLLLNLRIIICLCTEVIATDDICLSRKCACCKRGECIVAEGNICRGCLDGFTSDTCRDQCPHSCFNCSQTFFSLDRTCYACKPGYYNGRLEDHMELPLHKDCSLKCKPGCEICDSHNNCNQCNISYFMSSRLICEQCQTNCTKCSSATDCFKCEDQYFKSDDGGCKPCISNCRTCDSNVDCQECKQGFYLDKNECQICQEGCISCNDTRTCHECETGYHQFDSKCFHFPGIPCADNKNSIVCTEECLNRCLNRVCNDSDGYCTVGCLSGYWGGNACNQTCVTFCKDTVCNFRDGKCETHYSTQARHFGLIVGLVIGGALAIIIVAMYSCYFKRTHLSRRFKWVNAVDECLFLCCRCFCKGKHKDEEMEVVEKPLKTSSETTNAVNSVDKTETESLLCVGRLRIETDGTPCNNPKDGFPSSNGEKYNTNANKETNAPDERKMFIGDLCFINVTSYKKSSKYIVSYGSKLSLYNESFWKMIWESSCEVVVMLSTSELEEYNNRMTFGSDVYDITVRFASGRNWANYTMRPVTIEQETTETTKEKDVVLFEFFADIQDNAESFVEFHKIVNGVDKKFNGPTLVHSSAGVHRCVTYIAVDMLKKNAKRISNTDISLCLQHLNNQALETAEEQIDYISKILAQL